MKVRIAFIATTLSGFVALSYEIVWIRIYGFLTGGEAESFGLLLSAYLAGLALGGLLARVSCHSTGKLSGAPHW